MSLQSRVVWLDSARHHGPGRSFDDITLIVMHSTASGKLETARGVIAWMNRQPSPISYHYVLDRSAEICRMTKPEITAFHAGDSAWPNPKRATPQNQRPNGGASVNRKSLGLAFVNNNHAEPLTAYQVENGLWLCRFWMKRLGIGPESVVTHAEVSPGRKTDPRMMPGSEWRALLTETP